MQTRHLGTALLTLGALVGVAAGVGLVAGFEPATLPAALLNVAAYKLTLLAAFALLAAGAVAARHARRAAGPRR
jgi:gentisate 1,2-dioxygenase